MWNSKAKWQTHWLLGNDIPLGSITSTPLRNNDGINSIRSSHGSRSARNVLTFEKKKNPKQTKKTIQPVRSIRRTTNIWNVSLNTELLDKYFSPRAKEILCLHHSRRWQWSPAHLLFWACRWHFVLGVYWNQRPVKTCRSNGGEKGCRLRWLHTVSFTSLRCSKTIKLRLQQVTRMIAAVELNQNPGRVKG